MVNGTDTVGLEGGVIIAGNTTITAGNGDDDVSLDAVTAAKVTIKTRAGDDAVSFAADTDAKVTVTQVLVTLGGGDDEVLVGSPVEDDPGPPPDDDIFDSALLVLIGPKISKFTGGAGEDIFTGKEDVEGVAFFKDPLSNGFDEVVEQPAVI